MIVTAIAIAATARCTRSFQAADPLAEGEAEAEGEGPGARPDGGAVGCAGEACGASCCAPVDRCRFGACVPDLGACASDADCRDDAWCEAGECLPYGTGPRGASNPGCERDLTPRRFAPAVQCEWTGPPEGDPAPGSVQVVTTPLVADFGLGAGPDDPPRPSIVIASHDPAHGPSYYAAGIVRVLDGETCAQLDSLPDPADRVAAAATMAIGDLDGDRRPEIVAGAESGGVVAFGHDPAAGGFRRLWYSTHADGSRATEGGSTIPSLSLADLSGDGRPEILLGAMVFSPDGVLIDASGGARQIVGYSQPAVVADVDLDGDPEVVLGGDLLEWTGAGLARAVSFAGGLGDGFAAVGDFGEFPGAAGDAPGVPEVAVISAGSARLHTIGGEVVFGPVALPGGSHGGNPTVADFDGDGLAEFCSGGPGSLTVLDPDCGAGRGGACATGRADGILWTQPVRDFSSGINGATVFDFEGDGSAEVVYADECFARVFDGASGEVVWSVRRTSGTWIEAPIVADVDGDFNAELVVPSNDFGGACPEVDEIFAGLRCREDGDCASGACVEELCRCAADADCGADEYACRPPPAGTAGEGSTCRALFAGALHGVRVYRDVLDRWVGSRRIWNQHAYHVTNVREDSTVPAAGDLERNWQVDGLNNFRQNVQGDLRPEAAPDLTVGGGRFSGGCDPDDPAIPLWGTVCNRGAGPVGAGMIVTFHAGDPAAGGKPICGAATRGLLLPGACEEVGCVWDPAPREGAREVWLWVDRAGEHVECVEGNNVGRLFDVQCLE